MVENTIAFVVWAYVNFEPNDNAKRIGSKPPQAALLLWLDAFRSTSPEVLLFGRIVWIRNLVAYAAKIGMIAACEWLVRERGTFA